MLIAKWILVAVFLADGIPVQSGVVGTATAEDCETAKKVSTDYGHGQGLDVWAECREIAPVVKAPDKPKGEPGTERNS
jgi:hypothetical protein